MPPEAEDDFDLNVGKESKEAQMLRAAHDILDAWESMKARGEFAHKEIDSPTGIWIVDCKRRKLHNNRDPKRTIDMFVTRPRGVGGRYRTLPSLSKALQDALNAVRATE